MSTFLQSIKLFINMPFVKPKTLRRWWHDTGMISILKLATTTSAFL